MHPASVDAIRNPPQALVGWVILVQRLNDLGIRVVHVALPPHELGDLDTCAGVLRIRSDAEPDDQVWLLQQAWSALTIGPHACDGGKVQPLLYLVPAQRTTEPHLN